MAYAVDWNELCFSLLTGLQECKYIDLFCGLIAHFNVQKTCGNRCGFISEDAA